MIAAPASAPIHGTIDGPVHGTGGVVAGFQLSCEVPALNALVMGRPMTGCVTRITAIPGWVLVQAGDTFVSGSAVNVYVISKGSLGSLRRCFRFAGATCLFRRYKWPHGGVVGKSDPVCSCVVSASTSCFVSVVIVPVALVSFRALSNSAKQRTYSSKLPYISGILFILPRRK